MRKLGFTFPDSMANFIFATHETAPAAELYEALRAEQIYVRYFKQPRLDNYLRITIGTRRGDGGAVWVLGRYLGERKR